MKKSPEAGAGQRLPSQRGLTTGKGKVLLNKTMENFKKEVKIMRKLVILSTLTLSVSISVYAQVYREYDLYTRQSVSKVVPPKDFMEGTNGSNLV